MRGGILVLVLAVAGLFGATSIGVAAYLATRDSVGVPVTRLQSDMVAPASARREKRASVPRRNPAPPASTGTTSTGEDHGGSGSSGRGSDDSGRGRGGHGGDDD
jgi:hypothetical protein